MAFRLAALVACVSGCDGLVGDSGVTPPTGGTGGAVFADAGGGTGGVTVSPPTIDASTVDLLPDTSEVGGDVISGDGGARPDAGATGPISMTPCGPYPTGPALTATRFQTGTVVPNLSFKREDGSTVTFGELRCNKKNRILYWSVGGDNCGPCLDTANKMEVPAWKELGPQGLLIVDSFNGDGFLVSQSPWKGWRRSVPMWPADGDAIALVAEPKMMPFYAFPRMTGGIPFSIVIDLETMKVVGQETRSLATLRSKLMATPPRP